MDGDDTKGYVKVHPKGIPQGNDDPTIDPNIEIFDTEYDDFCKSFRGEIHTRVLCGSSTSQGIDQKLDP
jgi:hypothetical protein